MATTNTRSLKPILKDASDEVEDFQEAVRKANSEAYLDWPNEAGFENLTEQQGPIKLIVHGVIPSWASGTLYRTGPGVNRIEKVPGQPGGVMEISHWFDGLAHTHRFDIMKDPDDDRKAFVLYSSRRQSDDWIEYVQKHGPPDTVSFGQRADPCVGLFGKLMSTWRLALRSKEHSTLDNIGVTVQLGIPGLRSATCTDSTPDRPTVWLGTDTDILKQLDSDTLETLGVSRQSDLHPSLDGPLSCAHAMRCPKTGDYFNINIKPGASATYSVFRVSAKTHQTDILAEISRPGLPMAYIHSFLLSESFVVLRVPSSHVKAYGLGVLWEKNVLDAIVPFDEKNKCKWFVVDRLHGHGVVAEFETDAAFFFHTVNCFEEPGPEAEGSMKNIICDFIDYPSMDIMRAFSYDAILHRDGAAKSIRGDKKAGNILPRLVRWKLAIPSHAPQEVTSAPSSIWDWKSVVSLLPSTSDNSPYPGPLRAEQLQTIYTPHAGELPIINPAYFTRRHRYVYSLTMSGLSTFVDSIIKTDTETRRVMRWNNAHGHTPGETIFVAKPGATEEDDGVLLSVVLDGISGKSYLLCLNAQTMCEMGRAEMDFAVGHGFHGVHVGRSK